MLASEKKFIDILDDMFLGVEFEKNDETLFNVNHKAREKQGFVNLLRAKSAYFSAFKENFLQEIKAKVGTNEDLRIEFYDKLYDFFHRYFSPTGSVFYHQTPLFYNVFTKSYEKITSKDTELFYKTNMLYYVKSDKIYKELTIKLAKDKIIKFEVNNLVEKKANQKAPIIFEILNVTKDTLTLQVSYSQKGRKTSKDTILKEANKQGFELDEETLKKALNSFNKQSSFDFFINKNAKEFLSRELDLWIYQYLFSQQNAFSPERIKQIEDFKEIALKLIDFIAKFEDELVKIWTKPRFALNSHYLVSLSTLKEKGFDLEKIYKHKNFDAQKAHWQELGLKSEEGLFSNETLALDTRFFEGLKEEIEMLFSENELNGLLIKAENFGALNTLLPRFKDKIDLIYIDPPYNTGSDDFIYLDKFNHASWLTMMSNRLEFAKEFLKESGSIFISIDDNEQARLKILCDELFGEENFVANLVWANKEGGGKSDSRHFRRKHEYILCYGKVKEKLEIYRQEVEDIERYTLSDKHEATRGKYQLIKLDSGSLGWVQSLDYPIELEGKTFYAGGSYEKWLDRQQGGASIKDWGWRWSKDKLEWGLKNDFIEIKQTKGVWNIYTKQYLNCDNEGNIKARDLQPLALIEKYSNTQSNKDLKNLELSFNYSKPEGLIGHILTIASNAVGGGNPSIVLDFFAGSGTSAASALKLGRKFIGVEMGEHFDSVIIPRITKVLSGVQSGISKECEYKGGGIVKYYELESYEQILRTLSLDAPPQEYLEYSKKYGFDEPFLFDTRLSKFFNEDLKFESLYKGLDLKESLLNATGLEVKSIDIKTNQVLFKDGREANLIELLRGYLVW